MSLAKFRTLGIVCAISAQACIMHSGTSAIGDTSGVEDVAGAESDVEALATSFVGPDGASLATADDVAVSMADATTVGNPGFWFQPAGCLQVTTDTATQQTTYVFDACTGPLGLVALKGTVTVGWQLAGGALTLSFSAQDFQVGGATLTSWQATAVVTVDGDQRTMTWSAQMSGVTARGRQFVRSDQKDLTWTIGQACLSVSGMSNGTITGAHLETTITSWQRCSGACPVAGSKIEVQNLDDGQSMSITYEGGSKALLTIGSKSTTIALSCGG